MSKSSKILIWCIVAVVLVLILSVVLTSTLTAPRSVDFTEFCQMIKDGEIDSVQISGYVYTGTDKETGSRYQAPGPRSGDPLQDMFNQAIKDRGDAVSVSFTDPNAGSFMNYLIPLIGIILVCVVF